MGVDALRWALPALFLAMCLGSPAEAAEDPYKSFRALETRAMTGDLDAVTAIAASYENAEGLPRDYDMALKLYCSAARKGHAGAAYNIGWMFAQGRGIARDDDQAAAWFRLAAGRGHDGATRSLKLVHGRDASAKEICPYEPVAARADWGAPKEIKNLVERLAPQHKLDPSFVLAVIKIESDFQRKAVSSANAHGLMQLIPATAKRFGVQDSFDPEQNVSGGMSYLRWLLDRFGGNLELTLAAYNAGENAVDRYAGVPPYPETRDYLRKFGELGVIEKPKTVKQ